MTKDYTPTTEQVELVYSKARADSRWMYTGSTRAKERAAFRRWLAQVKAEAWDEGYLRGYRDRRLEKSFDPHQKETT